MASTVKNTAACALIVVAALLACRCEDEPKHKAKPAPPPSEPAPVETVREAGPVNPALIGAAYEGALNPTIADDCPDAKAIIAVAPKAATDWTKARQTFLANLQFSYVTDFSGRPGQVVFAEAEHLPTGAVALVARCKEGVTCKRLAAAYKTVVPTSQPELFCGPTPTLGELRPSQVITFTKPIKSQLPAPHDTLGKCVRVAACRAALAGKLSGDPVLDCQKKPASFPLECASEFPCAAVLACLEQKN